MHSNWSDSAEDPSQFEQFDENLNELAIAQDLEELGVGGPAQKI